MKLKRKTSKSFKERKFERKLWNLWHLSSETEVTSSCSCSSLCRAGLVNSLVISCKLSQYTSVLTLLFTRCLDTDECSDFNLHGCNHNCSNSVGSYRCLCLPGYRLHNQTTCMDIDECAEKTDNCHGNATCFNTPGSFHCSCNARYTGNGIYCKGI